MTTTAPAIAIRTMRERSDDERLVTNVKNIKRAAVPASWPQAAREKLSPEAYAYVAGGAGYGHTIRANRDAFQRRPLVPRMLGDMTARDLSTKVLNTQLNAPVILGPVGLVGGAFIKGKHITIDSGTRIQARVAGGPGPAEPPKKSEVPPVEPR